MICSRCYSNNIGKITFPSGRRTSLLNVRDICNDCGYMIMTDESILRSVKLKKIMKKCIT